jgi:hypothetical protein
MLTASAPIPGWCREATGGLLLTPRFVASIEEVLDRLALWATYNFFLWPERIGRAQEVSILAEPVAVFATPD